MAPFGSMGFAADGGVEMGGVVSSDGGRGALRYKTERETWPLWETLLILFGLCSLFLEDLALFVSSFSCLHMEWDFAQVSATWNPSF